MPINSKHSEYLEYSQQWDAIEDALAGAVEVKRKGVAYLPKLFGQEPADYEAYKMRAQWFNGTRRTHEAWKGMICRKEAQREIPEALTAFAEDCDLHGAEWRAYEARVISDLLAYSRAGTLIDWHEGENRPFVTHYEAEDIINWGFARIGEKWQLSFVILAEESTEPMPGTGGTPSGDKYAPETFEQWREVTWDGLTVTVNVHREVKDKANKPTGKFVIVESKVMARRGLTLPGLPFVFHGLGENKICPAPPLLGDIAEINFAHYRTSADHENALHICGVPTPWAAGYTDGETDILQLGSSHVWTSDDPNAKCGFLEFTGSGVTPLAASLTEKEKQMATLGARVTTGGQKAAAETATATKIQATAETATLATVAESASRSLSEVLNWAAWWTSTSATPSDEAENAFTAINREFIAGNADPAEIQALTQAFLQGALSFQALFYNFQRANLYPDETTLEDEQAQIEATKPAPPLPAPPAPKPPAIK